MTELKPCPYCKGKHYSDRQTIPVAQYEDGDAPTHEVGIDSNNAIYIPPLEGRFGDYVETLPINFCPMCGKPLSEQTISAWNNRDGWISVEERLPTEPTADEIEFDDYKEYIVMIAEAKVSTTLFYCGAGEFWDMDDNSYKITHWQPLPEPPKGVE